MFSSWVYSRYLMLGEAISTKKFKLDTSTIMWLAGTSYPIFGSSGKSTFNARRKWICSKLKVRNCRNIGPREDSWSRGSKPPMQIRSTARWLNSATWKSKGTSLAFGGWLSPPGTLSVRGSIELAKFSRKDQNWVDLSRPWKTGPCSRHSTSCVKLPRWSSLKISRRRMHNLGIT